MRLIEISIYLIIAVRVVMGMIKSIEILQTTAADVEAPEAIEPQFLDCQFDRIAGTFRANRKEVESRGYMITVMRGDRVMMFRRSKIVTCEEVE